jgi:Predicted periplasmic or secreted lipoprotein
MEQSAETKAVRAALERDPDINPHRDRIKIRCEGGTLRLEGEVENIAVKRRALQVARSAVPGVPVEDRLLLRVQHPRADRELLKAVLDALYSEPVFREFVINAYDGRQPPPDADNWLAVEIEGHRVILHGQAWSLSHRRMAEVLAWWVPGTGDVENRIRVQPPEQDADAEITDAIGLVFDKDPSLDAQEIKVTTRNGEVTLEGAVRNEVNARMAVYDCWYVPGVHAVHNRLHIRPTR